MGAFAWVTLATNDSYSLGALVLAHSLKQAGTAHQLAVLVTPGVTNAMREKLASVFNVVEEVNILDSRDQENLRLLKRPELGITFTKLHCWRLTQFEKCVFLDADTLMLQNSDELFERDELSAAPDVGWPDCFNSGVYVYRPSLETYEKLIQFALEKGSFDGGDQGLLNLYFSDWAHKDISKHLPFIYNMCSTACYSYLPAFKQFGANAKIIHFIGAQKPWLQYFNTETRKVQPSGDSSHLQEVLQRWWDIFCSLIYPQLSPAMAGLAGAFAQLTLGVARTTQQDSLENILRKQAWEVGNIDYLGRDSFDNIWSQISKTLSVAQSQAPEPEVPSAPAAIQSQTAPQEEAILFEPLVLPTDTPTDIVSSIDSSIKSSPPAEPEKEISQALESLIITPEVPSVTSTTEVAAAASNIEVPTPDASQIPSQTTPVAEEPLICPRKEVAKESIAPEPTPITPEVPSDTSTTEVAAAASNIEVPTPDAFQIPPQKTPVAEEPLICPRKEVAKEGIAPEPTPIPAELPYETDKVLTEKVVEQQTISSPESQKPIPPLTTSQYSAATETPVISATKTEESPIPAKLDISTPEFDSAKPSAEPITTTQSAVAPTSAVGKSAATDTEPEISAATETPAVISATKTEDSQIPPKLDIATPEFDSAKPSVEPSTITAVAKSAAAMDMEPEVLAATEAPAVISATKTEDSQIPAKPNIVTLESDSGKPSAEPFTTASSTVVPTLTSAVESEPAVIDTESEVLKAAVAPPAISTLKEVVISAAEKAEADKPSSKAAVKDPKLDFSKPAVSSGSTKSSPKTKVTAATPPVTPGTPPVEKTKRALTAETKIPDTPPPSAAGSTPTPPPRKTDKPKKAAAKPKK